MFLVSVEIIEHFWCYQTFKHSSIFIQITLNDNFYTELTFWIIFCTENCTIINYNNCFRVWLLIFQYLIITGVFNTFTILLTKYRAMHFKKSFIKTWKATDFLVQGICNWKKLLPKYNIIAISKRKNTKHSFFFHEHYNLCFCKNTRYKYYRKREIIKIK